LKWQVLLLTVWGLLRALWLDQHLLLFLLTAAVADEFYLQAIAGLHSGSSGGFCNMHSAILTAEMPATFWHVEIATFCAQN